MDVEGRLTSKSHGVFVLCSQTYIGYADVSQKIFRAKETPHILFHTGAKVDARRQTCIIYPKNES